MPIGPFDTIPAKVNGKQTIIKVDHLNDMREALSGMQDAYDVAVAEGFAGTRAEWIASLKGDDGAPGQPLTPKGTVADVASLPASGDVGDIWIVTADGNGYGWDGSAWVNLGPFRGPAGADGDLTQATADTLYADKGRIDPGTDGTAGQSIAINASLEPVYVDGPLHAEAFGVYGDGAAEGAAINSMIDKLNTDPDIKTSAVQFRGDKVYTIETPINIYGGVQLLGDGTGNAHAVGTFIRPHATFSGAAGVIAPDPGGGVGGLPGWLHQWHIKHLRIEDFPINFWSEAGIGESVVFDDVWVRNSTSGFGALFSGGGIPMHLGRIAAFSNAAGGVHIENPPSLTYIEEISGDDNGGPILKVSSANTLTNVRVGGIKAESSAPGYHDTVVSLEDLQGGHVAIEQMLVYREEPVSADPIIHQTRTNTSYEAGTFALGAISGNLTRYGSGYTDDISGHEVSGADLGRGAFDTRRPRIATTDGGVATLPNRVLTETIGTSETRLFHGMAGVPAIEAIIPHGNATVWQSSPPDASSVYLTASSSVDCDVVLSETTRQPGLGTMTQRDTFTAADGTNITSHTPDTGVVWSTSLVWHIYGNAARPGGGFRAMGVDTGATDVRLRADMNINTGTGTRAMYLFVRSDANAITNCYIVGFYILSGATAGNLSLTRQVGGTSYPVTQTADTVDISTSHTIDVLMRGRECVVYLDGAYAFSAAVDPAGAGDTWCGVYCGNRATAAPYQTVDNVEIWE